MTARLGHPALVFLLVVPWLWPWTPGPSASVVPLLAGWACLLAAVPLVRSLPDTRAGVADALPASWKIAAVVSAAIGIAQWFGMAPASTFVSTSQLGEAYGNLRQKNQFASLLALGLAAYVWKPSRKPLWGHAAVVLLAVANAASASRTGAIEWLVIAALAGLWPGAHALRLRLCGTGLAAYAVAALVLPHALEFSRGVSAENVFARAVNDLGCSSRRVLWANVLDLIAKRPWTGWGPGELDFAHYDTLYAGARFCDILDNAHNFPLHLAVEFGVPVAFAVIAAIAWFIWQRRPWREADDGRRLAWTALILIGLHSLLEYPLWYSPFQIAVVSSVLAIAGPRGPLAGGRAATACISVLGLVAVAWALSLYGKVSQAYKLPEDRWPAYQADPIAAAGDPLLFNAQLRFAELSLATPTAANAHRVLELARDMLHYSPEPIVAEKLIESAALLGYEQEAVYHALRLRAAFPERYAAWRAETEAAQRVRGLP